VELGCFVLHLFCLQLVDFKFAFVLFGLLEGLSPAELGCLGFVIELSHQIEELTFFISKILL